MKIKGKAVETSLSVHGRSSMQAKYSLLGYLLSASTESLFPLIIYMSVLVIFVSLFPSLFSHHYILLSHIALPSPSHFFHLPQPLS